MPNKKLTILTLASVFTLGTFTGVSADSNIKDIAAQINYAIKVKLNGNEITPTDTDGKIIKPIIYQGTSYLPVRAISEALNLAVDWEGETNTIILGEHEGKGINLFDARTDGSSSSIIFSKDSDMLSIHNQKVDEGIYTTLLVDYLPQKALFKLNKKYQQLTLRVGVVGADYGKLIISDYRNNVELKNIKIVETDKFREVTVDVSGIEVLQLGFWGSGKNDKKMVVTDAYLK